MPQPKIGSLVTAKKGIETAAAPGGEAYGSLGPENKAYVKNYRVIGGKTYVDLDFEPFGGGTGWAEYEEGNVIPFAPTPPEAGLIDRPTGQPVGQPDKPLTKHPAVVRGFEPGKTPMNLFQEVYGQKPQVPKTPEDVDRRDQLKPYLEEYEKQQLEAEKMKEKMPEPRTREEIIKDIEGSMPGVEEIPPPPKMAELYKQYLQEYGVTELETRLNNLKTQEENIEARSRTRQFYTEEQPTAMGVIAGRVGEIERQENERLDFVRRQKQTVVDELNTKYSTIQTMMNLTNQDYQNARVYYETKFNQAVTINNLIRGEVREEREYGLEMLGLEREEAKEAKEELRYQEEKFIGEEERKEERRRYEETKVFQMKQMQLEVAQAAMDSAKANLQVVMNAFTEGGVSWDQLSKEQRLNINKLEVQAGLPAGLMANIKQEEPQSEVLATNASQGLIQVVVRDPNGSIRVHTYGQELHKQLVAEELQLKATGVGKTADEKAEKFEKLQTNFMSDVLNPASVGISQMIAVRGEELQTGFGGENNYVSREALIRKLKAKWLPYSYLYDDPVQLERDIEEAVYYAYPD